MEKAVKVVRAELRQGMDSCVRALNMLRRTNVETSHFEMDDCYLTIAVAEDKERLAVLSLSRLADVRVLSNSGLGS